MDKMQEGKVYKIDHPKLSEFNLYDGSIGPNNTGFIGRNRGRSRVMMEGTLYFSRRLTDFPDGWYDRIEIKGMFAIFPDDGGKAAIYEQGTERPSSKADRLQEAEKLGVKFKETRTTFVNCVRNHLGASEKPGNEGFLIEILDQFTTRIGRDRLVPGLHWYLIGLEAASILNKIERLELEKIIQELSHLGDLWSSYLESPR